MTLLIVLASVAVYLAGWLWTARRRYTMTRPYTEPLSCRTYSLNHQHGDECYQRPEYPLTDTVQAAAFYAALWATGWPVLLIGLAVWSLLFPVIVSGDREDPAELRAQIARLERELGQKP